MIGYAIEKYLQSRIDRKPTTDLYVSDLGAHPYKAMARVLKGEKQKFDLAILAKMNLGDAFEQETLKAVNFSFSDVISQFPLWDSRWSGYADFVLGHNTDSPVIVEHKATSDKWWDYKGELVKSTHVCQLWLYGRLYEETYGLSPSLVLVYRAWGNYAEFDLEVSPEKVICKGLVNGSYETRSLLILPMALRQELEAIYEGKQLPSASDNVNTWKYPEESYGRLLMAR